MRRTSESRAPRPHDAVRRRLVREHYATFVAHAVATCAAPLPRYMTGAFELVRCHRARWSWDRPRPSAHRARAPRHRLSHGAGAQQPP
jgi:hypothetical protein